MTKTLSCNCAAQGRGRPGAAAAPPAARTPRARPGFTLLEMILVVSIILLLLSALIVLASSAHIYAQKEATRQLIEGVESALDTFYQRQGKYPDIKVDPKASGTGAVSREDVQLAMLYVYLTDPWYGPCMPSSSEGLVERLPAVMDGGRKYNGYPYLVDAWRNPLRFVAFDEKALQPEGEWLAGDKTRLNNERRKWALNGGRPLIWSLGPDGRGWSLTQVRDIGTAEDLQGLFYGPLNDPTSDNVDNLSNFRDVPLDCLPTLTP